MAGGLAALNVELRRRLPTSADAGDIAAMRADRRLSKRMARTDRQHVHQLPVK
jgi:hypothetical protein